MPDKESEHLWVMSNRQDDRVSLWERDPAHPGNEAFVAGAAPALVGRSPEVARLLREGRLIEVPEPKDGRKKPAVLYDAAPGVPEADLPGRVTRLGRTPDPELFDAPQRATIAEAVKQGPAEVGVPAGVIVPPAPAPERNRSSR